MPGTHRLLSLLAGVAGLLAALALAGCGGGGGSINLKTPVESGTIGSISGTLYSITNGSMDIPGNVQVSLAPVTMPAGEAGWPRQTTTNVTGSYQFADVPAGTYRVRVDDAVNGSGLHVSGEIADVVVRGGIPTLNANLVLGPPGDVVTFNGTVRENGQPAAGATVTMEITALQFPENSGAGQRSVYVTTTASAQGAYSFTVPNMRFVHPKLDGNGNPITTDGGATVTTEHYAITAHSATSGVADPMWYYPPIPVSPVTVDPIVLSSVTKPAATSPTALYQMSVRLPAASMEASLQAAVARLAIARLTGAPATRIVTLQKIADGRQSALSGATVRAASAIGVVENDLNWEDLQQSMDVQGYHVYRSSARSGDFIRVGTSTDPYNNVFVDNDPALPLDQPMYYTVTGYAARGIESKPMTPVKAQPLPALANVRSVDVSSEVATTTADGEIKLRWDPVAGAVGYIVMVYTKYPSFSTMPDTVESLSSAQTSLTFTYPGVGGNPIDYWWIVSAFNVPASQAWAATSAAYSAFHAFTLSPASQ